MTAMADIKDKIAAFAAGGVDYVTKPFQVEELLARITTHLTLRAAQKQLVTQNAQLHTSEARYRRLFETAKDGILLLDFESGQITDVNASIIDMLGYSRNHFLNQRLWDIAPFKDIPACRIACAELQSRQHISFDHWPLVAHDGSLIDVEFVGNVYQVDGIRIAPSNIRDLTGRIQDEARIRYMALHDALTGLPNRILLLDRLSQAIALGYRNRERVAVLMLDLDHFKHINDSLGHHIGDLLLEQVSVRLKACLRDSDIVARLGGDEFVIALPGVLEDQAIEEVVRKVLAILLDPFQIEGHELLVSSSIGISKFPEDGGTPGILLQAADTAMYAAKTHMRGSYRFFTPELNVATQRRLLLMADLHHACALGQFSLNYQPQVSTNTGTITAVEALLLWNHPQHGSVSPAEL